MPNLQELWAFLASGGWTLPLMFGLSVAMWVIFLERAYFLRVVFPRHQQALLREQPSGSSPGEDPSQPAPEQGGKVDVAWLSRELDRGMDLARMAVNTLPLLGLLGTVAGMIESFEALSVFGNSNPRALSGGISHALISTMVGLVTSIAGLYVEGILNQRILRAKRSLAKFEEELSPFAFTPFLALRERALGAVGPQGGA